MERRQIINLPWMVHHRVAVAEEVEARTVALVFPTRVLAAVRTAAPEDANFEEFEIEAVVGKDNKSNNKSNNNNNNKSNKLKAKT